MIKMATVLTKKRVEVFQYSIGKLKLKLLNQELVKKLYTRCMKYF